MIEMKLGEALGAVESLKRLMLIKMPSKAAYRLARIGSKLQSEFTAYDVVRNKRIKELGEPFDLITNKRIEGKNLPDSATFKIEDEDKLKIFMDEQTILLEEIIRIDMEPAPLSMVGDAVELMPQDLITLEKIIIE